jgi:hypothetical protein
LRVADFFFLFPADAAGGGWKLPERVEGVSGGSFDKFPEVSVGGYEEYVTGEAISTPAGASDELSVAVGL